jgi:hypothetical protein
MLARTLESYPIPNLGAVHSQRAIVVEHDRSLVDVQGAVHAAVRNMDSYHSRPVSIEARAALN